jgi:hypothetical protein
MNDKTTRIEWDGEASIEINILNYLQIVYPKAVTGKDIAVWRCGKSDGAEYESARSTIHNRLQILIDQGRVEKLLKGQYRLKM